MRSNHRLGTIGIATTLVVLVAQPAAAQCQILVRDSFRLGTRPHGGNGRPRDAFVHDTLSGYWPGSPAGVQWMSSNQSGLPTWAFAASSIDPAEVDPLDPFNGTAFGEAPAAALLQFTAPGVPFTISAEAVMGLGTTSTTYLGFTSDASLQSNFESFGTLWMTLDGQGQWSIRANGNQVVASGTAPIAGTLGSGWLHMEMTYDPAGSLVSGRIMETPIAPTPVTLTRPFVFVGMEAYNSWNVLNNLSVFTGTSPTISTSGPNSACAGGSLTLSGTTNAAAPAAIFWARDGQLLADGVRPGGSIVTGANGASLTISNCGPLDAGAYACIVTNECGLSASATHVLSVGTCCPADLDNGSASGTPDGGVDINDLLYFLARYEAGSTAADLDDGSGLGVRDGGVDINDLLFFLTHYEGGC